MENVSLPLPNLSLMLAALAGTGTSKFVSNAHPTGSSITTTSVYQSQINATPMINQVPALAAMLDTT